MAESDSVALPTTLYSQGTPSAVTPEHKRADSGVTTLDTHKTIVAGGPVFYNLDYGTYGWPQAAHHLPCGMCETLQYRETYAQMEGGALGHDAGEQEERSMEVTGGALGELTTGAQEGLQLAEGSIARGQYGANALTQKYGQTHVLHMMALELHEDPDGTLIRVVSHLMETTMNARTNATRGRYGEKIWESVRTSAEKSCWPGLSRAMKAVRERVRPGLDGVLVEARFDFESSRRGRLVWTISCQGTQHGGDVQVALPKANYKKLKEARTRAPDSDQDTLPDWKESSGR